MGFATKLQAHKLLCVSSVSFAQDFRFTSVKKNKQTYTNKKAQTRNGSFPHIHSCLKHTVMILNAYFCFTK